MSEEPNSPPGVTISDLEVGSGSPVERGDWVEVEYTARCQDATFASTAEDGHTFEFCVGAGHVVPGWDAGMPGMRTGGRRTLQIDAGQGYGDIGYPPMVPGGAAIEIDIRLVAIKRSA